MRTDNELIAEFLGATLDRATSGGHRLWTLVNLTDFCKQIDIPESRVRVFYAEDLRFDTSWDWLMPVVEKILETADEQTREINNEGLEIFEMALGTPIGEVHKAVVQFIKWYNSQDKQREACTQNPELDTSS